MKPTAYIFDVDGTLANIEPYLHYIRNLDKVDNFKKDFNTFHEKSIDARPNMDVVQMLNHAVSDGHAIIVVTSRKEMWRPHTSMWLALNNIRSHALFMRKNDDDRKDYEVKKEILKKVRSMWDVVHAVDDNPAVLKLWEENNIPTTKVGNWDGSTD